MSYFTINVSKQDYNNSFFRPVHGDWEAEYCTAPASVLQYAVQRTLQLQQDYYNEEFSSLKQEIYFLKQELDYIKTNIHHINNINNINNIHNANHINNNNKHDIIRLYNTNS